jgi:phosphatidylglycerophosphatase A
MVSHPGASRARVSPRWKATSSSQLTNSRSVTFTTRLALAIATVGGIGWAPVAPGTVASAVTIVALWLLALSRAQLIVAFVVVTLVGIWAAEHAERALGTKDPGAIVIDEVAGMTLSVLVVPLTVPVAVLAFLLFRVFDIVKPAPARQSQVLPGGAGVMVDDLIAGLYALIIVVALRALLGWL